MSATVTRLPAPPAVGLREATGRFTGRGRFEPATVAAYRETLDALWGHLGEIPVDAITTAQIEEFLQSRWGAAAPATFNRHRAGLVAFFTYTVRQGWRADNPTRLVEARKARRRSATARASRAISRDDLARLFALDGVPLRDRTLWVLAYETWGRAGQELLTLNVEDMDLANRQAVVAGKGGDKELVFYGSRSARLLKRLIADRTRGSVFLSSRRASPGTVAPTDLSPDGYPRLSYRQAADTIRAAGQRIDPTGPAWTLHRLRHAGVVHACDGLGPNASWSLPAIMAKSRHQSIRSVERYAYCPPDTAAALTDDLDHTRRKR